MCVVDLSFPLHGTTFPSDHGYALYSAVSRMVPKLHELPSVGLHPVRGIRLGPKEMGITRSSCLRVRLAADLIPAFLPLAGAPLEVGGHMTRIGVPRVLALAPVSALAARIVTIKGFLDPDAFLEAVRRQLNEIGLSSDLSVGIPAARKGSDDKAEAVRRVVRIRDKTVVGFAVQIHGLSPVDSLALQKEGVGGRRHMGCGIFVPVPRKASQ